jgi:hypothetical protein
MTIYRASGRASLRAATSKALTNHLGDITRPMSDVLRRPGNFVALGKRRYAAPLG